MRALGFASAVALGIALLALSASGGGCGGNPFTSGGGDGSTGDGDQGDGSSSGGGDAGMPGEGGDGPAMTPGHTIYVAPSGKDTNSGLDTEHPVRTIKKGVAIAQELFEGGVEVPNVLVCTGSYPEDSLHLTFDIGLFGAYDCTTNPSTWTRAPNYGWPTFDKAVASTVTFANTTAQTSTLAIDGSVSAKSVVDGFTIAGGAGVASAQAPSLGVEVALGASPVLANLVVSGGGGAAGTSDAGSIGVRIGKNANPELKLSVIDGGSGKGPAAGSGFGSIGVRVEGGAPNIHDDIISGGSGDAVGYSSVGIDVLSSLTAATNNPLSKVLVVGADNGANPTGATIAVYVRSAAVGANLDVLNSLVLGSDATTGTVESIGVEFDDGGKLTLLDDRIAAGSNAEGSTLGVQVTSASEADIVDCEIHGGDVPNSAAGHTRGINLTGPVAKASIVFDTIYTGANGGTSGTAGIEIGSGVGNVTIEDDLLFGADTGGVTAAGAAVIANACSGSSGQLAALTYTGFVNFPDLLYCNDLGTANTLPAGITNAVDGPTVCKKTCGNVLVATTCVSGKADCEIDQACPTQPPDACVQSVLGSSWPSAGDGLGAQGADAGIASSGWQIEAPGNYCKLTAGGTPVTGITTDMGGHTRSTTTPSMGAVEYTGSPCAM